MYDSVDNDGGDIRLGAGRACSYPGGRGRSAFTVVELLVVISIASLLLGILLPCLQGVRKRARQLLTAANQRQVVAGVNLYASDNTQRYPSSVARIGLDRHWNWGEPFTLSSPRTYVPMRTNRSVAAYLQPYLPAADVMTCPCAPARPPFLEEFWAGGRTWANPSMPSSDGWLKGTYCLYWGYEGLIDGRVFSGPRNAPGGSGRLLTSCYLGRNSGRSADAFVSCQSDRRARRCRGDAGETDFWVFGDGTTEWIPRIAATFYAGYADGHVESYSAAETAVTDVILRRAEGDRPAVPYPPDARLIGQFLIPAAAVE